MKNSFTMLVLLLLVTVTSYSQSKPLYDSLSIVNIKSRYQMKDTAVQRLVDSLSARAKILETQPIVTVMDKDTVASSGNKHDYFSFARYWWPNPKTETGFPYVRRDGNTNPHTDSIGDAKALVRFRGTMQLLANLYFITGNERYAYQAQKWATAWFIDTATRMNPRMTYSSRIPGQEGAVAGGIIQSRNFVDIAAAIQMLQESNAWNDNVKQGVKRWYDQMLNWLITSKEGRTISASKNNHGSFYDLQVLSLANFTGNDSIAIRHFDKSVSRLRRHIDSTGAQPKEISRSTGIDYSVFNLDAWFKIASLGEQYGIDVWNYGRDSSLLKSALDYILPYAMGEVRSRKIRQIKPFQKSTLIPLLVAAIKHWPQEQYSKYLEQIKATTHNAMLLLPIAGLESAQVDTGE